MDKIKNGYTAYSVFKKNNQYIQIALKDRFARYTAKKPRFILAPICTRYRKGKETERKKQPQ